MKNAPNGNLAALKSHSSRISNLGTHVCDTLDKISGDICEKESNELRPNVRHDI